MVICSRRSRLAALAGVAALVATPLVGASPQTSSAAPTPAPAPTTQAQAAAATPTPIRWTRCWGIQCGELEVPLDYADPSKGTTTLAIGRRPADNQAKKKGVIFVNPGGPGGSAVGSVPIFAQVLGRNVRSQFDIVGIDPRGVGGSDLAICEGKKGEKPPESNVLFPWREEQIGPFLAVDEFKRHLCRESRPKILPYMTTADVARDMDRVREALGQKQLNYYGVSYGSYLGATYANMFPSRVRTMVVDGVLDPVAWATGRGGESASIPVTTRLRSDIGAHESLMSAIAECEAVGESGCREHDTIRDDWAAVSTRLRNETVNVTPGEEGMELTYDVFIALTLGSLYDPEGIPDLLAFVHQYRVAAEQPDAQQKKAPAAALKRAYDRVTERDRKNRANRIGYNPPEPTPEEEYPPSWWAGFEGVICSETRNPDNARSWISAGAMADRRAPGFGPLWTSSSSVCAGWPAMGKNAYQGPFTTKPAGGILVMTTKHDPATPFPGARQMHALSPGSRMITVSGWGHGALDSSGCATKARNNYLISGTLPATDKICRPDHDLFTTLD